MVDFDWTKEYSSQVYLDLRESDLSLSVYPNPSMAGNVVTLESKRPLEASEVKLVDMLGRSYEFQLEGNVFSHNLHPGEYVIQYQGHSVKWFLF